MEVVGISMHWNVMFMKRSTKLLDVITSPTFLVETLYVSCSMTIVPWGLLDPCDSPVPSNRRPIKVERNVLIDVTDVA
jgi:hypothetical protein